MSRSRPRLLHAAVLAAALSAVWAPAARAADTVVTFGFDDGLTSQYAHVGVLDEHGVKATFFVNSGRVGQGNRMTWAQIAELAADGQEIGGHTLTHPHLTTLSQADQQTEICDDRTALVAQGYTPRSFAYPFGNWNATTKAVVAGCGYETARTTGGTDYPDGPIYAETFPPLNAYTLRAIEPRKGTSFAVWQDIVQEARNSGGGWVNIVLHDVCDPGPSCDAADDFAVSSDLLDEVLDWLATLPDVKVRTTAHALDVAADATAPTVALTAPADGATVATGTVGLSATASDAVGVVRVRFLVDGVSVGSDTSAPYTLDWDASDLAAPATIVAKAYDEAGNTTLSAARTVVPDRTAPTVVLTAPVDGDSVTGTVSLSATASDDVAIDHVNFVAEGVVVGRDDSAPYALDWDSSGCDDDATLSAEAVDTSGNERDSADVEVRVTHPVVPPPLDPPRLVVQPAPPVATIATADRTPPRVRIVAIARQDGRYSVRVEARDASPIRVVRLLLPGGVVRSDARAPYVVQWRPRPGRHAIAALAIDAAGNRGRSASTHVWVRD